MMQWPGFDEEHRLLAERLDSFARSEIEPRAIERGDTNAHALDVLHCLANEGLLRYVVPREWGGLHSALDIRSVCLIRWDLARFSSLADTMFALQGLGS